MKDLRKIAIIGHVDHGKSALSAAIAHKLMDMGVEVEIVTETEMSELHRQYERPEIPMPIIPQPQLEYPTVFNQPISRKQRRAQQRKTK